MKAKQIALVLVLVAAAWYLASNGPKPGQQGPNGGQTQASAGADFQTGLKQLNAAWEKHGINASAYDFQPQKLAALSESEVADIRASLQAASSGLSGASKELAGIHLLLAGIAEGERNLGEAAKKIGALDFSAYCDNQELLKQKNGLMAGQVQLLKRYKAKYDAFRAAYPSEATAAGLSGPIDLDVGALEANLSEQQGTVLMLEKNCGGA